MNPPSLSPLYRTASCGFTLAELLVVLLLIAVMTTSVAVALQGREDPHALRVAAEDLATALRYAESESRRSQKPLRLVLAEDGQSFWVEFSDRASERDTDFVPVRGLAGQPHTLTDGITLSLTYSDNYLDPSLSQSATQAGAEEIYFGRGVDSFAGELLLQNEALDALRVVVLPETGQVRVVVP